MQAAEFCVWREFIIHWTFDLLLYKIKVCPIKVKGETLFKLLVGVDGIGDSPEREH